MSRTLRQIARLVESRAARIGAEPSMLPTFGRSQDFARPHIEIVGDEYHYVIVERGLELERARYLEIDDLLYRIFESVTFEVASRFGLEHRRPGEDFRRQLFAKQLALFECLDPAWRARAEIAIDEILRSHPYND